MSYIYHSFFYTLASWSLQQVFISLVMGYCIACVTCMARVMTQRSLTTKVMCRLSSLCSDSSFKMFLRFLSRKKKGREGGEIEKGHKDNSLQSQIGWKAFFGKQYLNAHMYRTPGLTPNLHKKL